MKHRGTKVEKCLSTGLKIFLLLLGLNFFPARSQASTPYTLNPGPYSAENLGSIVQTTTQEGQFMIDLPGGEKHALTFFDSLNSSSGGNAQLVDLDLQDKSATLVDTGVGGRTNSAPLLASNGKFYMFTSDALPDPLIEYDPQTKSATIVARMPSDKCTQSGVIGDDGKLYFGGCTKGTAAKFDPSTNQLTEFGRIDTANPSTYFLSYTIGSDGRYVFVGLRDCDGNTNGGGDHYYLGVYDQQTGTSQIFFKDAVDSSAGDSHGAVNQGVDGKWYYDRYNYASYSSGGWYRKYYRLDNGVPVEISSPPKFKSGYEKNGVISGYNNAAAINGYQFDLAKVTPDSFNPQSTIRWKAPGDIDWQSTSVNNIRLYPVTIKRIASDQSDNQLIGSVGAYGIAFKYDPASKTGVRLGSLSQLSLYDILFAGNDIYFSGYAAETWRYDPSKPWSLNPSTPNVWSLDVNPRQVAGFGKYHYYTALGSDGFVYIGVSHLRDNVTGGSLGWYDPATESKGSIHLDANYRVGDLTTALSGSKIICSLAGNKIIVFDAATKNIEREIIVPGEFYEPHNVEIAPGIIFGVTESLNGTFLMYKANVQTGEIISQQTAAGASFGSVRDYDRRLILGPDKHIWMFIGNSVYRINPDDFSMQKIIDIPSSNLVFNGSDLYFYGGSDLLRIKNLLSEISSADLNSDSKIDLTDFNIFKLDFQKLTGSLLNLKSDINADGQATVKDVGILMSGWKP